MEIFSAIANLQDLRHFAGSLRGSDYGQPDNIDRSQRLGPPLCLGSGQSGLSPLAHLCPV